MARPIRVFDGSFGRLQLVEATAGDPPQESPVPQIVVKQEGADLDLRVEGESLRLTRDSLLFVSPGVQSAAVFEAPTGSAQLLCFQASNDWLRHSFPAVFDAGSRAFGSARETITARIRQLADTLAVEVRNDQFLSHERLEFMLQELMLSIVETYLARRASGARLWRGSP